MYKTKRFVNTTLELRFNNIFAMIPLLLTFKSFLILLIHSTRNFLKFWPSLYYIACQESLEHLNHFFIIHNSNHNNKFKSLLIPKTMLIWKIIVPVFQQSHGSSCHPYFITTKQHCSEGERGESQSKTKLAKLFQGFWRAL